MSYSVRGQMTARRYYSVRVGKNQGALNLDLATLKTLFTSSFRKFDGKSYFQEAFGYPCVDAPGDYWLGDLGQRPEAALLMALRKPLKLEPIEVNITQYSEDDLFDLIEFLYDCASRPAQRYYHDYANCGWHSSGPYDRASARTEFRNEINSYIRDYQNGYELTEQGEILSLADTGLQTLIDAQLPTYDPTNVEQRVDVAVRKFRRHGSSLDDRRDAIRDLADVLEYLRPKIDKYLLSKKDDVALFGIANNFAIRHHNEDQQSNYNRAIWYSWMFYFYLATVHAAIRVIREVEGRE